MPFLHRNSFHFSILFVRRGLVCELQIDLPQYELKVYPLLLEHRGRV